MRDIKIRDLETGDTLVRQGHTAREILRQNERYVEVGNEPKDWAPPVKKGSKPSKKEE